MGYFSGVCDVFELLVEDMGYYESGIGIDVFWMFLVSVCVFIVDV